MKHIPSGRTRRALRTRGKLVGTPERPRLCVFRSNQHVYVQLIDDMTHTTLLGVKDTGEKGVKTELARELGRTLAKKAQEMKIKTVIFDKGSYMYHGRVKAVAEGAREGGLSF